MLSIFSLALLAAGAPVAVAPDLLSDLPIAQASITAHGKSLACEGPLLRDVVAHAEVAAGQSAAKGRARLAQAVLITARDGYRVLFSRGELDGDLGASHAIVATRCTGATLSAEDGPYRLVVPGEARAARSARQVATITLLDAEAAQTAE